MKTVAIVVRPPTTAARADDYAFDLETPVHDVVRVELTHAWIPWWSGAATEPVVHLYLQDALFTEIPTPSGTATHIPRSQLRAQTLARPMPKLAQLRVRFQTRTGASIPAFPRTHGLRIELTLLPPGPAHERDWVPTERLTPVQEVSMQVQASRDVLRVPREYDWPMLKAALRERTRACRGDPEARARAVGAFRTLANFIKR